MALINAGVGKGQVIAEKLWKCRGIGKGHMHLSPSMLRIPGTQGVHKKFTDARVSADLPPPIMMKLGSQSFPTSYTDATSKSPKKKSSTEDSVHLCNVWLRDEKQDKKKAAAQATLAHIVQQEQMRRLPERKKRSSNQRRPINVIPSGNWPRKGSSCRSNTIGNVMPLGLVLTLSLTCWVGVSTCGPAGQV